jgi:nitrate reductase alpha subunit
VGAGAGATTLALGLSTLRRKEGLTYPPLETTSVDPVTYGDWTDTYRSKWTWDRIVKGTTIAPTASACLELFEGRRRLAGRTEAVYGPSREGVPDFNPRGRQKGAPQRPHLSYACCTR